MKKLIYLPVIALCLLLNSCAEPTQEERAIEIAQSLGIDETIKEHKKISEYELYEWAVGNDISKDLKLYKEIEFDEERKKSELFMISVRLETSQGLLETELPKMSKSKKYDVYRFVENGKNQYIVLDGQIHKEGYSKWMNVGLLSE